MFGPRAGQEASTEVADEPTAPRGHGVPGLVVVLAAGLAGASGLTLLGVPAGGIIGAVLGSAAASVRHEEPRSQPALRTIGLVLLGTAAALRLNRHTLAVILDVAGPLLAAIAGLVALNVALAFVLHRWLGLDPVTALLAAAPGGVSEIAGMADAMGAQLAIVVAIHVVRVVAVVLVALPLLIHALGT